jgi:hypothetical protein
MLHYRLGSPNLQILALQCYFGRKEGLSSEQVIRQLAELDAMLDIDSLDCAVIETYTRLLKESNAEQKANAKIAPLIKQIKHLRSIRR